MTDFSQFLIASDLDGTFLGSKGRLVQRNLDAITRFCANGGKFTLNTGRPHITICPNVPQIATLQNAPSSHCNGAYLYDFQQKEFFFEELLSHKDVDDLLDFALTYCADIAFRANAREQIRVFVPEGCEPPQIPGCESYTCDRTVQDWPRDDWYKLVFVGDPTRILRVRHDFERVFGNRFAKTTSSARALEVQLPTSSKAVGLDKMRRLSPEMAKRTVIACGDYENDIPMLRAADIAICPANAMDEVKAICNFVLCDCNEGLIADIIENIEAGRILPKEE